MKHARALLMLAAAVLLVGCEEPVNVAGEEIEPGLPTRDESPVTEVDPDLVGFKAAFTFVESMNNTDCDGQDLPGQWHDFEIEFLTNRSYKSNIDHPGELVLYDRWRWVTCHQCYPPIKYFRIHRQSGPGEAYATELFSIRIKYHSAHRPTPSGKDEFWFWNEEVPKVIVAGSPIPQHSGFCSLRGTVNVIAQPGGGSTTP